MQTGNFLPGAAAGRAVPWLSPPVPAARRQPWPWSPHPSPVAAHYEQHGSTAALSPHPCTLLHPTAPLCTPLCPPPRLQQPEERTLQAAKIPLPKPSLAMHSRHPQFSHPASRRYSLSLGDPSTDGAEPHVASEQPPSPHTPQHARPDKEHPRHWCHGELLGCRRQDRTCAPPAPSSTGSS